MSVNSKMTALADEIRELSGTTDKMGIDAMTSTLSTENADFSLNLTTQDNLIAQIQTALEGKASGGGIDTSDATAVADDILLDKTAYVNGQKITGTMPNNGDITTTFDGINSKSFTIPSGYTSGGTVSLDDTIDNEVIEQTDLIAQIATAVDELPESKGEYLLQDKTIIPSAGSQTVIADSGYDALGRVTVNGDTNLVPENIISGVRIFNVVGSATAADNEAWKFYNSTPYQLMINGVMFMPEETKELPFSDMLLFGVLVPETPNGYLTYCYSDFVENDNGEIYEETYTAAVEFVQYTPIPDIYLGLGMECPIPGAIVTITEEQ